jgi:WD40 repeat protein
MNRSSSRSSKGLSSDIVATLGFVSLKTPPPSAVGLDHFSAELFFHNYRRPDLNCVLTADHIEHGFLTLGAASQTVLPELISLIDHFFMFAFCDIIVGDGKARAQEFLTRQSKYSSFPEEFIDALGTLNPDEVDSFPEISQFLMQPSSVEFSPTFYRNLNVFIRQNQVPGSIVILKQFLHDEETVDDSVSQVFERNNRPFKIERREDNLTLPFTESNVPQLVCCSHQYSEFKASRTVMSVAARHPPARSVHLPSLTARTVPRDCVIVVMDPCSPAIVYTIANNMFYVPTSQQMRQLQPHLRSVSAVTFSSCGQFVLTGDTGGCVRVHRLADRHFVEYESIKQAVTALTFEGTVFAAGGISGTIFVYQVPQLRVRRILGFHNAGVTFLCIHPNLEYIASGAMDGLLRLSSISMGTCVRVWRFSKSFPLTCRFSHDGRLLLVVASDGILTIFDVGDNKVFRTIPIEASVIDAVFAPNDQIIAVADKTGGFSLWETRNIGTESLTVLRIDKMQPLALGFADGDEVKVVGCSAPRRVFDDGLSAF